MIISSIFIKKQFKLTRIIRQVNDLVNNEYKRNNFQFTSNNNITREVSRRDGLHLNNDETYIYICIYGHIYNLANFLTNLIFSKSIWLNEDDITTVGKDNSQGFDSSDEVKHNNSIDYKNDSIIHEKVIRLIIGNSDINSISNKFHQIKLFVQGKVDILIFTDNKLDATFPTSQFMIDGYNEAYCFDRNRNRGGVLTYIQEDIPSKLLADHRLHMFNVLSYNL